MRIINNYKKTGCIFLFVMFIIISIFVSLIVTAFMYEPVTVLLPTKVVEMFLLYDHIEYCGVDYYFYDASKKPKGIIPDFDKEIEVVIANSNCRAYGKNTESAYLCDNDSDHVYIYYGSCFYVSDKSLASEPWK